MLLITTHEYHVMGKRACKYNAHYLTSLSIIDFMLFLNDRFEQKFERTRNGGRFDILNIVDIGEPEQDKIDVLLTGHITIEVIPTSPPSTSPTACPPS